jgi:hypothetical protein
MTTSKTSPSPATSPSSEQASWPQSGTLSWCLTCGINVHHWPVRKYCPEHMPRMRFVAGAWKEVT